MRVLGFYDISRAHFHSKARRKIAIKVPKEDSDCKSGYAILDKSMYGTKDAAQCFDLTVEEAMTVMGYSVGVFSPCLYHHPKTGVQVFRHGDDFVVLGTRQQQKGFLAELGRTLIVKHLATLGPNPALGDSKEVRILNRIVRWVKPPYGAGNERLEYEADPRHAELIVHQLGLSASSRGVSTPGEKSKPGADFSTKVSKEDHALYRSATMRLCYLALDRPDLQYPAKELARWMQAPTLGDLEALKRVARYLVSHGRLVQQFVRQVAEPTSIIVYTDSDHAGCLCTRKSTSSTKLLYGSHLLRSTSSTQGIISLSTGESEFYSLVKGTAAGLGAVSMLKDLGVDLTENAKRDRPVVEVRMDASAGRGVALRRGAGRIRHIATPTLWVQKLTQDGKIKVTKVPGATNPADLGTKHLSFEVINRCLEKCSCFFRSGRSDLALRAEVQEFYIGDDSTDESC